MSDEFDPYLNWLAIHPHEHPVDHYRLLGVTRFESSSQEIAAAADERMRLVRSFQTGPRGHFTHRLLNELSSAKLCLLDSRSKAVYDDALQYRLNAAALGGPPSAPPPMSPPLIGTPTSGAYDRTAAPPASGEPTAVDAPPVPEQNPFYKRLWLPIAVAGGIVLVAGLVCAIGYTYARNARDPARQQSAKDGQPTPSPETPAEKPEENPANPPVNVIAPEANGAINFPVSTAVIHGSTPQLRIQGDDSVIGDWTSPDDWLSWEFDATQRGIFKAEITYSASEASAGGQYELAVGDQSKTADLRTGDPPGDFVTDELFLVLKRVGRQTCSLRMRKQQGGEFMVLKSVRFVPK